MNFANNTERTSFLKGEWPLVEMSPSGDVIYMGKPSVQDAAEDSQTWFVKKITITSTDDGGTLVKTEYAQPYGLCSWSDRKTLEYKIL